MRGVYCSTFPITGLAAARTLMILTAPAGRCVEILSASVTDESNATNFQLGCSIDRVSSLGSPTATPVTPVPTEAGDQAAGATVVANVTASEPTYGAVCYREGAAAVQGWRFDPLNAEERVVVAPGASVGLRLLSTPASFNAVARITHREIG